MTARSFLTLALFAATFATEARADSPAITLASTTSTENSGLFAHLLPRFTEASGIVVRVVAVGTGQALRIARNGDADVLLVHHRSSEETFVAEGYGVRRHDVMYNDFVLVGPGTDPAALRGLDDAAVALARVAATRAPFASRGDDSGTHKKELDLWAAAGLDPSTASGTWYRETGSGMGATLNAAVGMGAYALSDRATWLAFRNKGDFQVLVEGDQRLFNPYGAILVNPARHPHVHAREGQAFIDWLVSDQGQDAIAAYRLDGRQLFFPNAN
ncbi:MAG: substrate-binding domain-containing protein [Alphaproteobacteria bacterium]